MPRRDVLYISKHEACWYGTDWMGWLTLPEACIDCWLFLLLHEHETMDELR